MELIKKYWMQITGTIAIVSPLLTWVGNAILEGAEHKGYVKAKEEINEEYNDALRDAIIYRAKYEGCCSTVQENQ